MATLYNLTGEYIQLLNMAADPETDPELLADTMEAVGGEIEDKAQNYAIVRQELKRDVDGLDAEIRRLTDRKRKVQNNIQRLENALKSAMEATGKRTFKTQLFSFTIKKNPPAVVLDVADWKDIPENYLKHKDPEIDKAKLKEDLKAGKAPEGIAHLEQAETLLIK